MFVLRNKIIKHISHTPYNRLTGRQITDWKTDQVKLVGKKIMNNFCPLLKEQTQSGVFKSLRTILDKKVLASLSPLFDYPKLDKELRNLIRLNFAEFCSPDVIKEEPITNNNLNSKDIPYEIDSNHIAIENNLSDAAFSDDDEEQVPNNNNISDMRFHTLSEIPRYQPVDITEHLQQLDGDIRDYTVQLQNEKPIAVLRSLDTEANRFYDRNHQMYNAALLTRCYT